MKTLLAAFAATSLLLLAPAPFAAHQTHALDQTATIVSLRLEPADRETPPPPTAVEQLGAGP